MKGGVTLSDKSLLSVTEASEIMGLGRSQILRLCNQNRLPGGSPPIRLTSASTPANPAIISSPFAASIS